MPEPLTLKEAKAHLRVEFDDDDLLIESLIVAAREWAEGFLNLPLVAPPKQDDDDEDPPAPVVPQKWKQAMLLMIGHWYQNRENVSAGSYTQIPMGAEMLLWQDRRVPV